MGLGGGGGEGKGHTVLCPSSGHARYLISGQKVLSKQKLFVNTCSACCLGPHVSETLGLAAAAVSRLR